jgi:hypothetical protein
MLTASARSKLPSALWKKLKVINHLLKIHLFIYLSILLAVCPSVHLSTHQSNAIHTPVQPSYALMPMNINIQSLTQISVFLYIHLSVHSSSLWPMAHAPTKPGVTLLTMSARSKLSSALWKKLKVINHLLKIHLFVYLSILIASCLSIFQSIYSSFHPPVQYHSYTCTTKLCPPMNLNIQSLTLRTKCFYIHLSVHSSSLWPMAHAPTKPSATMLTASVRSKLPSALWKKLKLTNPLLKICRC